MEHIGFTMRIARQNIPTYVAMHAEPWPELITELDRTGWINYSLFLGDDGALVGYLEAVDWVTSQKRMSQTSVAPRWSEQMDRLVVPGSLLAELALAKRLESPPAANSAIRRTCAIFPETASLPERSPHFENLSIFASADGLLCAYGEFRGDVQPPWPAALGEPATPLREVFNLAEHLRPPSTSA